MRVFWTVDEARAHHTENGGWLLALGPEPYCAAHSPRELAGALRSYPGATYQAMPGSSFTIFRPAWGVTASEADILEHRGHLDDYDAWRLAVVAAGYDEEAMVSAPAPQVCQP